MLVFPVAFPTQSDHGGSGLRPLSSPCPRRRYSWRIEFACTAVASEEKPSLRFSANGHKQSDAKLKW